ncbi:MAG TPA: peptidylprolyl isomerase, partial [Methyloceanibacter sp.]|nr:peptidylprolyl isomerase [Methyloceanibacter sp.]
MKTWSALLLVAAFIGLVPLSATAADDPVLARVNGVDIKQSDLDFAASEVGPRIASLPMTDRRR